MYGLDRKGSYKRWPVFQDVNYDRPTIYSLIKGNHGVGRVFVDDAGAPSRAFIEFPDDYVGEDEHDHDHAFNSESKERILTQIVPSFSASGGSSLIPPFLHGHAQSR